MIYLVFFIRRSIIINNIINYSIIIEGDRKANIDVLESNKAANKEEIKRLRDENKELRQKLALLQRV
jgi:cell division protein FtsB